MNSTFAKFLQLSTQDRKDVFDATSEAYVLPRVKLEGGARSALDPHQNHMLQPYIIDVLEEWNFRVDNVTTIDPQRTFWDKIMILHGWYCGYRDVQRLPSDRQRLSRHYYDVAMIYQDARGKAAVSNVELAEDVRRYTKQLFNRGWMKLDEAVPGTLRLVPERDFKQALMRDYQAMQGMMLGDVPTFAEIVDSISALEADVNSISSNL